MASNRPPIRSRLSCFVLQSASSLSTMYRGSMSMSSANSATSICRMNRWAVGFHHLVEAIGQLVGGLASNGDMVVAEDRLQRGREEECQRTPPGRQVLNLDLIHGNVHLGVEVENPELIKVAEHDVSRAAGNQPGPVIESLPIVPGQVFPAFLHLNENDRLPDQISERGPLPVALLDPLFQRRAGLFQPGMPESLEEPVQEDLGLPLLIPLDVRPNPRDEIRKPLRSLGFHCS